MRRQYADETRLSTRASVWRPAPDGRTPQRIALDAITATSPAAILEVGCGTGAFAAQIAAALPSARVVATDQSERMVQLTAARGLETRVADVGRLPFEDDAFDVVVAMYMLYHVPDLDRAIGELRRVLRPGGSLVAATSGEQHLADLLTAAGGQPLRLQFSRENGEAVLRRRFEQVSAEHLRPVAVADHAAAVAYLASLDDDLAEHLPPYDGEREYHGAGTVFVAR